MSLNIKIGTDPEVFLSRGGKFISADGIIPGTKDNPYLVEKGALQVDGVAAEFNIHPASSAKEFSRNIETVLNEMRGLIRKVDPDIQIVFTPFAKFEPDYFSLLNEKSKILGCDPDFNCRTGLIIEKPDITDQPFRTAAGHVHIGWTENEDPMAPHHFEDARFLAEHFNKAQCYLPGEYNKGQAELERLKYYGADGAFRPKPYGVELRQYSNRWVEYSENREYMYRFIEANVKLLAS